MNKRRYTVKSAAMVKLDIQITSQMDYLPSQRCLRIWCNAALSRYGKTVELTLRIVDADESRLLNRTWRGKDSPTNVLAFPADSALKTVLATPLLGDLVICAPIVAKEALSQNKPLAAHWAHIVIHGCLHLLGYDHRDNAQAETMENLERQLLAHLGYPNPYAIESEPTQ